MAFAQANSCSVRYSKETLWAEDPSTPTMTEVKFTGESLSHSKDTVQSNVIRTDRMRDDLLQVGVGADGDINIELAYTDFDDFLVGLCGGTEFTTSTSGTTTTTVAATARTFTRTTGSYITDGFVVGQWVKWTGFTNAGNAGPYRITTLTATVMTVADPETHLVDEAGSGDEVCAGKMLRNGGTLGSFLIEKAFTDITKFVYFVGCMVSQIQFNITAKEIVTGTISLMGKKGASSDTTVSGSVTPAGTKTALTASANVGHIYEDNTLFASFIRSLQFTANNNLRAQDAVGDVAHVGLAPGFFEVRGTIEFYLSDLAMYQKMENHTPFSLSMRFTDPQGNILILTLPKLYLGKTTTNATGGNTDVMVNAEMEAVRDSATNCIIQFDAL